ncbi:IPO11 protein, partial [Polypterus senegalus]
MHQSVASALSVPRNLPSQNDDKKLDASVKAEMVVFQSNGKSGRCLEQVYLYLMTVLPTSVEAKRAFSVAGVLCTKYKLIRRRVIWLIGQWISVKFKSELRPLLYEAILNLMQDPDLVYLESIFSLLFQLLQQVTECDTKMHILHVISCVVERVNTQIKPYVGCLVQYLPLLWKQSEDHNMLRCAILTTLIHLVKGLGAESKNLYPFLLPVIQLSTDVNQPPHVYLLEDGLELCVIMDKFCGIINICVEALHDVMTEDPDSGTYKDCMLITHFEEPKLIDDEEPPSEQDIRKKMDLQERSQEWDDDMVRSVQFCNKVDDVMTTYKLLFDRKKKQQQLPITMFLQTRKKEPVPTTTTDTPSETVEEVPQEMAPPSEET